MENSFFEPHELTSQSRTWATIDLSNLKHNIKEIQKYMPDKTKMMGVVKADAYGHGDVRVAKVLLSNGIDFLAVSNIDEALSLRKNENLNQQKYEILILGYTPVELSKLLNEYNIQQTIISYEYGEQLDEFCKNNEIKLKTQIKVDTGMTRLGLDINSVEDIVSIYKMGNIEVCGIFSHLSSADGLDVNSVEYTKLQQNQFEDLIKNISKENVKIGNIHLQNSAGVMSLDCEYDYARVGLLLYGISPISIEEKRTSMRLKPVMSIKSVVAMVRNIESDVAVSYGRHYVSEKPMKIATIPIGYADGYSRALSNKGKVLIRGEYASILGNVCMDQIMVDVTDIDVKMGDIVTLVGEDNGKSIYFDDIANLVNSIPYELVCLIGKRVPREEKI